MAKYDLENFMDDVTKNLQANLNAQISTLNTEKSNDGQGITLAPVDSTAYHFQYPEDRIEMHDPFIIVNEAADPALDSKGPYVGATHHVGVTVILVDSGTDQKIVRRLFRYRRALTDWAQKYWDQIGSGHKLKLSAWTPTEPFGMTEGQDGRAVGVILSVEITD